MPPSFQIWGQLMGKNDQTHLCSSIPFKYGYTLILFMTYFRIDEYIRALYFFHNCFPRYFIRIALNPYEVETQARRAQFANANSGRESELGLLIARTRGSGSLPPSLLSTADRHNTITLTSPFLNN